MAITFVLRPRLLRRVTGAYSLLPTSLWCQRRCLFPNPCPALFGQLLVKLLLLPVDLQDLGIYGAVIFLVALLNSCGLRVLTLCTQAGGMFHLAGVLLLVLIVPLMATTHQPASWVFGHFESAQAESVGITNYFNIAILGLLLPAYSYTGMDGPCHMSEEVEGASMHPPKAILHGWAVMFVGGESLLFQRTVCSCFHSALHSSLC